MGEGGGRGRWGDLARTAFLENSVNIVSIKVIICQTQIKLDLNQRLKKKKVLRYKGVWWAYSGNVITGRAI